MPKLVDANGIDSIGDKHRDDNDNEGEIEDDEDSEDSENDEDEIGNQNPNDNLMNDTQDNNTNNTLQLKWLTTPTTFTSEEEIKNFVYAKPDDLNRWTE